ncbi:MAG: thioesterase, partial [Clostridiaceae bacterium]|nr:thioesterase [Clostridiaceae bacterium]
MYTFESRVRYSETDEYGRLTVNGIMNYLQDCSTFQSEDLGLGIRYLEEKKKAWWLNSWQIVIDRQPRFAERIRISTWPHGFKGIYGYRNFTI